MKNVYKIEKWRYHICVDTKSFTNKKEAQKWLNDSCWWLEYDYGQCMIYIYKNNERIDWISENRGWKKVNFD